MRLQLNPALRLSPPSAITGSGWTVDNVLARRRYRVSREAAAALVAAGEPMERDVLVQELVAIGAVHTKDEWATLVDDLASRDLLIDEMTVSEDPDLLWLTQLRSSWSRLGWGDAVDYHVTTFDYPCVDYGEAQAIELDRARMMSYQSAEPDRDRYKLSYLDQASIVLPEPTASQATASARSLWSGGRANRDLDEDTLLTLLSLTFGRTGEYTPVTDSAPVMLRTSPSGGGRHPSEGYVLVRPTASLLRSGWYHVTMDPFSLRLLDWAPLEEPSLHDMFPFALGRSAFEPEVLIVLTSVFERNMYRYREPRTFRTVHMDAGHLAATGSIAARALGLQWAVFPVDDGRQIEAALGIDGMTEGYMATIAVAGRHGTDLP